MHAFTVRERKPGPLALSSSAGRTALFYRAASLPASPQGSRSSTPDLTIPQHAIPATHRPSFEASYGYERTGHESGQGPALNGNGRDYGKRSGNASQGDLSSLNSSKAQRLLGLAHQLEQDTAFRSASQPSLRTPRRGNSDDASVHSFVDFHADGESTSPDRERPFSISSVDTGFDFAPPTPTAIKNQRPPSPTITFVPSAPARTPSPAAISLMGPASRSALFDGAVPSALSRKGKTPPPPPASLPRGPLPLPPTTNMLSTSDRAELLRKHKKLQQVLGGDIASVHPFSSATDHANVWPPSQAETIYLNAAGQRRHSSTPFSPISPRAAKRHSIDTASLSSISSMNTYQSSFVDMDDDNEVQQPRSPQNDESRTPRSRTPKPTDSMVSFADSFSSVSTGSSSVRPGRHRGRSFSVDVIASPPGSPQSWVFVGNKASPPISPEEDRRRKRARLMKLHRFLGSRVPAELVLGTGVVEEDLPPISDVTFTINEDEAVGPSLKGWIRRKRGSAATTGTGPGSGATSPTFQHHDEPRLNAAELGDRERMVNVKRAQKMEKVFGAPPPQSMFHTRPYGSTGTVKHRPAEALANTRTYPSSAPTTPRMDAVVLPAFIGTPGSSNSRSQRPWNAEGLFRRDGGDNESSRNLLGVDNEVQSMSLSSPEDEEFGPIAVPSRSQGTATPRGQASAAAPISPAIGSPEFRSLHQSITSLGVMIDRGDKESLIELIDYVNENSDEEGQQKTGTPRSPRQVDVVALDRRRSLPQPSRTSMSSASSILSFERESELAAFGVRRRRAAKLANFFGVQYRELVGDVLESLEMGVHDEASRGSLMPDEVQELISRLNALKSRGVTMD